LKEARVSAGDAAVHALANDEPAFACAISGLLDDPDERARMGALGRRRVEESLSWDRSKERLLEAYRVVEAL
jgi:glycosyltransferase involved in cell wall biosynthesis